MEQLFPSVPVALSPYPPPPLNVVASKVVGAAQFAGLAVVFAGDQLLPLVTPALLQHPCYLSMKQNKIGAAAGLWIVGNVLHNSLTSTGAFEVSYNGLQVFSKLQEKRMPSEEELVARIRAAVEGDVSSF